MSIADRLAALDASREIRLASGWGVRFREVVAADLLHVTQELHSFLAVNMKTARTIQMIRDLQASEGGKQQAAEAAAEMVAEAKAQAADPDALANYRRLADAAIMAAVDGLQEPKDDVWQEVAVVEATAVVRAKPGERQAVPLRSFRALFGAGADEVAEAILWRAAGGEAGQKAALAFRSRLHALRDYRPDGGGLRVPPVATAAGADRGSAAGHGGVDDGAGSEAESGEAG